MPLGSSPIIVDKLGKEATNVKQLEENIIGRFQIMFFLKPMDSFNNQLTTSCLIVYQLSYYFNMYYIILINFPHRSYHAPKLIDY
jgi:hypothetical protein